MKYKFDTRKLDDYIKSQWKNKHCSMCQANSWTISDTIYELRKFMDDGLIIGGGPILPVIPIMCDHCGNTLFINAYHVAVSTRQE